MDIIDVFAILAILALAAVTLIVSGKWKLLVKKPTVKFDDEMPVLSGKEAIAVAEARKAAQAKKQAEEPEKVLCGFCESYVDVGENETCPNCGASLKEAIEAAAEKKALIELEMMQIQNEMERDRMEMERRNKMIDLAKAATVSLVAPVAGTSMLNSVRKKYKKK